MKYKRNYYSRRHQSKLIFLIVLSAFASTGCKKFVEVGAPSTQIVTASVFSDNGAAHAALVNIYSSMINESYNISRNTGLSGDELTNLNPTYAPLYSNSLIPITAIGVQSWNGWYNYIYQANAVLEGLNNISGVTPAIARQLSGEAKFIRAFWHFYLINQYGDAPLVMSINYRANQSLARTPKDVVYRQIIEDLMDAQQLLNTDFVNETDTTVTEQRARPCKAAAAALLARVYLYTNKFDSAALEASNVISDSRFSLAQNLNSVFLADSSEAIWQLAIPQPNGNQTVDGNGYVLLTAPGTDNMLISPQLLASFEPGDLRMSDWINSYTDGITTWYYPFKYQVHDNENNPNNRSEAVMMLRLAEQYLIRADARAQQNDINDALSDLNVIRHRAGLGDYSGAIDQASVIAAILHERQVEFFTEWGHRWFDLQRTGAINSVMGSPGNVCQQKGGTWSTSGYQALFPIPQTEINQDKYLTQNPGY